MRAAGVVTAATAALAFMAVPGSAQSVASSEGTPFVAEALTGFQTRGADMLGMEVTGYSAEGSITGTWTELRRGVYGVTNDLFSLVLGHGDTFASPWSLSTGTDLFRLVLSGAPGRTLFDRSGPWFGTDGSYRGADFRYNGRDLWGTSVLYTNAARLGSRPVVGDLFERVDIAFASPMKAGSTARFRMDSDNVAAAAMLVPETAVVPEPASVLLLLSGLVGLGLVMLRGRTAVGALSA